MLGLVSYNEAALKVKRVHSSIKHVTIRQLADLESGTTLISLAADLYHLSCFRDGSPTSQEEETQHRLGEGEKSNSDVAIPTYLILIAAEGYL